MSDEIGDVLAQAYQLVHERNRQTAERWKLDISTGVYLSPWHVVISNGKRAFSGFGLLVDALHDVIGQWQQWIETQSETVK